MAVLLDNTTLGVRRRAEGEPNSHGELVAEGWSAPVGIEPGRAREDSDGTWHLALDPSLWPVRVGDLVIDTHGGSWVVQTTVLLTNSYDSSVDYVRATALQRTEGGTQPADGWFVARGDGDVAPVPAEPGAPQQVGASGMWTGYGPPPPMEFGAQPGDEYLDLLTGTIYELA